MNTVAWMGFIICILWGALWGAICGTFFYDKIENGILMGSITILGDIIPVAIMFLILHYTNNLP